MFNRRIAFLFFICTLMIDNAWTNVLQSDVEDWGESSSEDYFPPEAMQYQLGEEIELCKGQPIEMICGQDYIQNIHVLSEEGICSKHSSSKPLGSSPVVIRCGSKTLQDINDTCEGKFNCFIMLENCGGETGNSIVKYSCKSSRTTVPRLITPSTSPPNEQQCRGESKKGVNWPDTKAGQTATGVCPGSTLQNASWKCKASGEWERHPDVTRCVSSELQSMQDEVNKLVQVKKYEKLNTTTANRLVGNLVSHYHKTEIISSGDIISISSLMETISRKTNHPTKEDSNAKNISQSMLNISSNLMNMRVHRESWIDISVQSRSSVSLTATQMMSAIESSAFQLSQTLQSGSQMEITENIVQEVYSLGSESSEDLVFPDKSRVRGTFLDQTQNSIRLTAKSLKDLSKGQVPRVVFVIYNNIDLLLISNNSSECLSLENENCSKESSVNSANSQVISAAVNDRTADNVQLSENVTFTLKHLSPLQGLLPVCSYWNFNTSSATGQWMNDNGCSIVDTNATHTTCTCNHLTSFAIIMSPTGGHQMSKPNEIALTVITYIGCSISIVCLFLSFVTFCYFRNLQCDRNTIHKNLVACLFVVNILFIVGINRVKIPVLCAVIAGFLDYFLLASFAWMCIEGIQLYFMLVEVFESEKSRAVWFYISGYGAPAIIVGISAAVYRQGFGTPEYCWLSTQRGFIWSFLGPVIAIMLFNVIMLAIAIRAMYRHTTTAASWRVKEKAKLQQIKSWVKGAIVLACLLGLTWFFGLFYVNQATLVFAYIFTILNSLQGTFIFVFHCCLSDKVKSEYKRYVRHSSWLPECIQVRFGGSQPSSSGPQNSTAENSYLKMLKKKNESESSTLKSSSQQKSTTPRGSLDQGKSSRYVNDSGFEDPSSGTDPDQIHFVPGSTIPTDPYILPNSVPDKDYIRSAGDGDDSSSMPAGYRESAQGVCVPDLVDRIEHNKLQDSPIYALKNKLQSSQKSSPQSSQHSSLQSSPKMLDKLPAFSRQTEC